MFVVCGLKRCTELELIEHAGSDVESTTFCAVWCSALLFLFFWFFKSNTAQATWISGVFCFILWLRWARFQVHELVFFFFHMTLKVAAFDLTKALLWDQSAHTGHYHKKKKQFSILKCEKAYHWVCCPSSCQTPCPSCRREHWSLATYRMKTEELDQNELLI